MEEMRMIPREIFIPHDAPYLPEALRSAGEIRHVVRCLPSERRVYRRHKTVQISEWVERHRVVSGDSNLVGKWKNSTTPYLTGIMKASFFSSVRTVILCAAPQVGKTELALNCLAYAIDRDPGPALFVYPDERTARENNEKRIQPLLTHSPRLRNYMTGVADDKSLLRINLEHMAIYMAWAHSATSLANKAIRYLIFDEVDKYPAVAAKGETDPISLGEIRKTTYKYNHKVWKMSTTTTEAGYIWRALTEEAQVIFDYWIACPACRRLQAMEFKNIKWPRQEEPGPDGRIHSEDPETIEAERLARYECPNCGHAMDDYDRDLAVRGGAWRRRAKDDQEEKDRDPLDLMDYLEKRRPLKIGFHLPSWLSPFVSLSEAAAAFLRGRGDVVAYKNFQNKHAAEPWKTTVVSKSDDQVLASCCDIEPQTVPAAAILLTCGIDVQMSGFWFVVRAWSPELTNWLVHYGFLSSWTQVEALLFDTAYPVEGEDRHMRIRRVLVDTGGTRKYEDMTMTDETYFWIAANKARGGLDLWGAKGSSSLLPGMLALGNAILSTPSGKKLPQALRLLSIDTEKAKDQLHFRLALAADEATRHLPGASFLHRATGRDYVQQILAEEKVADDRGREAWVNRHKRPNHLLDAEVLAGACVEMEFPGGGLRVLAAMHKKKTGGEHTPEGGDPVEPVLDKAPPARRDPRGRRPTGWFKRR